MNAISEALHRWANVVEKDGRSSIAMTYDTKEEADEALGLFSEDQRARTVPYVVLDLSSAEVVKALHLRMVQKLKSVESIADAIRQFPEKKDQLALGLSALGLQVWVRSEPLFGLEWRTRHSGGEWVTLPINLSAAMEGLPELLKGSEMRLIVSAALEDAV